MIRLLGLVGCVLAGVVATEVAYWPGRDRPAGDVRPRIVAAPAVVHGGEAKGLLGQRMGVVLARPLFAPDRKPAAGAVAADPAMPRLTGIIASPDGAMAIFQPAGNVKPLVARHGDTVGGWEVTKVSADSVDLWRAPDRIVLVPRFDNLQIEAGKSVKPTPTRWEAAAQTGLLRARWSNAQLQP